MASLSYHEPEEVIDMRPTLTGNYTQIHHDLFDGLSLIFSNSTKYAEMLATVPYIFN